MGAKTRGVIGRGDSRGDSTFGRVTPQGDHSPPYPHGVRVTPGDTATASRGEACHPGERNRRTVRADIDKTNTSRLVYAGTLAGGVLALKPGAHVRTIDATGDRVAEGHDADARLVAEVGTKLIVSGKPEEAISLVEVERMEADRLHVRLVAGELEPGPGPGLVYVMDARGLSNAHTAAGPVSITPAEVP